MRTIADILAALPKTQANPLPAPTYTGSGGPCIGLAVESMKRHTTSEGWELFAAVESAGYILCGHKLTVDTTDVPTILERTNPGTVLVQCAREWATLPGDFREPLAKFRNVEALASRPDVFKAYVAKDAHSRIADCRGAAEAIGAHAFVHYYHPAVVAHLAGYVRPEHLIRTWHSIDQAIVPPFKAVRTGYGLVSGAVSSVYPLRKRIIENRHRLPRVAVQAHPGYHRKGCATPAYLELLSQYRVSICTSSIYGYALRKIVESTAAGCIVVTDLPVDEVMPGGIDANLVRVDVNIGERELGTLLNRLYREWDADKQKEMAARAVAWYDFREVGKRLAADIEAMRQRYNSIKSEGTMISTQPKRMTEDEALAKMVPPGRIRPGKMGGGGIIQILLTRSCTLSCFGCTQSSQLAGKPNVMPLEAFEQAVLSLKGYFGLVALFGGQPTLHPRFPEVCEILAKHVPIEKRGLWTNALNGHGAVCRKTFLPHNCNLNVHLDKEAFEEFRRDWPEARPFGVDKDSRHSPVLVAMKDVIADEGERWALIADCKINIHWSALIGMFRGEPRAWFCEVAGMQAMVHQDEQDYPDTGVDLELYARHHRCDPLEGTDESHPIEWWQRSMAFFRDQVRKHCHECSVPLNGYGELSQAIEGKEQVSATHAGIFKPKRKDRQVEVVTKVTQLGIGRIQDLTKYIQNGAV